MWSCDYPWNAACWVLCRRHTQCNHMQPGAEQSTERMQHRINKYPNACKQDATCIKLANALPGQHQGSRRLHQLVHTCCAADAVAAACCGMACPSCTPEPASLSPFLACSSSDERNSLGNPAEWCLPQLTLHGVCRRHAESPASGRLPHDDTTRCAKLVDWWSFFETHPARNCGCKRSRLCTLSRMADASSFVELNFTLKVTSP